MTRDGPYTAVAIYGTVDSPRWRAVQVAFILYLEHLKNK